VLLLSATPCISDSLQHDIFAMRIIPILVHVRAAKNETIWTAYVFSIHKNIQHFSSFESSREKKCDEKQKKTNVTL